MISQTAEYALRAVVWLAGRSPDEVASTARIADGTGVPSGYLSKVLQALVRAGITRSVPGRRGGVRLTRAPADVTLLDVIRAVDPDRRIRRCPLGHDEHHPELCPLHAALDEAIGLADERFERTTIADLVPHAGDVLCPAAAILRERGDRAPE